MRLGDLDEALRMIKDSKTDNPYISNVTATTWRVAHDCAISCVEACPTIDAVPVVRCKDCVWYKPQHFAADDGTEHPWDGMMRLDARSDGIYIGGKCKHERNTAYGRKDMAYRKPDDFCSYGERKDGDTDG